MQVLLKGKRGHETLVIVLADDTCDNNTIRMNKVRVCVREDGWGAEGDMSRARARRA